MSEMEKKYGRYAIRNLPLVMIVLYGIGFAITMFSPSLLYMLTLDPYAIVHGQIWRIFSWLLILPDYSNIMYVVIILYCYYSIGSALERIWGTWRYNVFILRGILLTVLAAFVWMGFSYATGFAFSELPSVTGERYFSVFSQAFSTYYLNLSILVAFAMTIPDAQFLLFFLLPVKAKYIAVLDLLYLGYGFVRGVVPSKFAVVATFINLAIFWITGPGKLRTPAQRARQKAWRDAVSGKKSASSPGAAGAGPSARRQEQENRTAAPYTGKRQALVHKCAICGRTNVDHPELEFRYCSKCEGGVEYCQDHLFTHVHIRAGERPRGFEE